MTSSDSLGRQLISSQFNSKQSTTLFDAGNKIHVKITALPTHYPRCKGGAEAAFVLVYTNIAQCKWPKTIK